MQPEDGVPRCCGALRSPADAPLGLQEHKEQGNEALKAGRFEDAVRSYTKAVEADSEDPTFYCNRAIAYTKMGHFEKAVSDAEDAIGVNPRHMKAYSVGGTALLLHGKKDDALRMYRRGASFPGPLRGHGPGSGTLTEFSLAFSPPRASYACTGLGLEPDNALLKERVRQAERHNGSARGPSSRPMPSAWGGSATGIPPETGLRPGQGLPTGAASLQAMATSSRLATLLTVQGALRSFMLLQTVRCRGPNSGSSALTHARIHAHADSLRGSPPHLPRHRLPLLPDGRHRQLWRRRVRGARHAALEC